MSYSGIHELTDFQATNLLLAANGAIASFAVVEPATEDDSEIRAKLERYMKEAAELVEMGLTTDVSAEFAEQIKAKSAREKRSFKVYQLTENAYILFTDAPDRIPC